MRACTQHLWHVSSGSLVLTYSSVQRSRASQWTSNGRQRAFSASSLPSMKAAAMIIGDEILSGNVTDTNTPWLAKLLFNQGVDFVRAEYIPDDKGEIGETLQRLREKVGPGGAVFSSGGIGPTHDDVTYEAIATALGATLEQDEGTVSLMRENYGKRGVELNASRLRMALLPTPSEILRTPGLWVPLVHIQGVYILPGIPRLFQQMIEAHKGRFRGPQASSIDLMSPMGEGDLAEPLRRVAEEHAGVAVGSYPHTAAGEQGVKISLTSRDEAALAAAEAAVRAAIEISP